jgi:acyl-CoA synthetase (AMP-forming)/AMP-acid ligase II
MGSDGQELPAGQAGEIAVRGPSIMEGYYGKPRDTAKFFRKGWFHTGDLGMLDDRGFLHFLGRRVSITKIASQMVDLAEIEFIIQRHPEVARARAIIRHDPKRGREFIAASIVLKEGSTIGSTEIKKLCQQRLSSHKIPRSFKFFRQRLVIETLV